MTSLRLRVLLSVFLGAFMVGALANALSVRWGGAELMLSPSSLLVSVIICAPLMWLGVQVSRFRQQDRRVDAGRMNPLLAARTVVLAQSSAYTGVMIAGWHSALLSYQLYMFTLRAAWPPLVTSIVDVLAGALLCGVGVWVEHLCKIPPSDSDDHAPKDEHILERDSRGYARQDDI
ncbi:DUF3180 domain-containing protein [Rothia sp. P6271]|uniref:DUF3180 domain-containing protein n=1 Tax=Rothia sp. P6271 TaxID=3402659 RepID=UPI003AC69F8A